MAVDTTPVLVLVAASTAPTAVKNVAEFVCDGTADQVEINAALAAVASTGGLVQLTPGTYNLSAAISPTNGNTMLRGSGWSTVLRVNNAANMYAVTFAPTGGNWFQGFVMSDLKIDGNGANQASGGGGIDAFGAVWCQFDHLWITTPWANGLYLHQDNLGGFGHHNEVTGCFFELGQNSNGGDGRGLRIEQSDENYIAHNTFQDNGRAAASEPNHIYDLAGLNVFHHNSFVGGQTGLKLQGPDSLADGNVFDGCKNHSIRVNGARCQVLNNKLYHLGFTGTNLDGIFVDNVADTQILDNLFDTIATVDAGGGTARSAINLSSGPATNAIVGQNRILATGMAYGTGAVIPGAGAGHLFRDNKGYTPPGEFNVKDRGATGNGSTDDRAAMQACIDATAAGDTVVLPPGTYLISAPLVLKPFRRYMGQGPQWADQTVIKAANGSSANFQSTSTHSGLLVSEAWNTNATVAGGPVDIRFLSLDGNKANNATGQHSGLILYGEYWSTLVGLRSYNNKKHGLLMTRTAKNNVAQLTGISDIGIHDFHAAANDGDGICQLSSGGGNNTDVMFTGRTVLYDNGGSGCTAENPGGWWLNNWHLWNNGVHGVYMDSGTHGVKINGLYIESFGVAAVAGTQYFGLRLRTFNAAPTTNTVPVQLSNVTVQTTDPAGTSSFYCVSVVGDGTDAHAYLSNVHALGAATARGHGIELYSASGTFTLHESGVSTTGFNAGQAKEYAGTAAYAYDPPRVLTATTTWNPASATTGTAQSTTVTVTGAAVGDISEAGLSTMPTGTWELSAQVTAANTVTVTLRNDSGSTVDPASGTLRATVWKH